MAMAAHCLVECHVDEVIRLIFYEPYRQLQGIMDVMDSTLIMDLDTTDSQCIAII